MAQPSDRKSRLLAVIATIPPGRVARLDHVAAEAGCADRVAAGLIADFGEADLRAVPWHRVVHAGGAIGRHARRDLQIALLRAEGLAVAPVGIVADLAERQVAIPVPAGADAARPEAGATGEARSRSRSRARMDRPQSTVGRRDGER